jgi:hypothetical protein
MNFGKLITRAELPNLTTVFGNLGNSWNNDFPNDLYIKSVPKNFLTDFGAIVNVGAARTRLHRIPVIANLLKTDKDQLRGKSSGTTASNDNDKSIQFDVDGTNVISMGLTDIDGSIGWIIDYIITRISNTTIRVIADIKINAVAIDSANVVTTFTLSHYAEVRNSDVTLAGGGTLIANSFNIDVFAQGSSNADITQNYSTIDILRFG